MLFLTLSLLICNAVANSINNENQRIIGGFTAYDGQFPYQVSLRWNINGDHFCDGSIISADWVLSSASCISGKETSSIKLVVGSIYLDDGGFTHSVSVLIPHQQYNPSNHFNDIGVIRVIEQIVTSNNVRPVTLGSDPSSVGLPLTVSSWGTSNILQWLIMLSISNHECQEMIQGNEIFDTQICTVGRIGQGMCGDYGSPLVYRDEQHGISAWSVSCGGGFPDVYTRVSTFRNWIRTVTDI